MSAFEAGLAAFNVGEYLKAYSILKLIAERGNAEAQCVIGNMYHLGLGMKPDLTKAVEWYQKSSDRGYGVASNNLATILTTSELKNLTLAKKLSRKAAKQGFIHNINSISDLRKKT